MITVHSAGPGSIAIDFSAEPSFQPDVHGVDLEMGLSAKRRTPTSLIVDDTGRPLAIVEYIKSVLVPLGFQVQVEAGLARLIEGIAQEEELVEAIRNNPRKGSLVETPVLTKLPITRPLLQHQLEAVSHALAVSHAANFSVPGSGKTSAALCTYAVLFEQGVVNLILVIGPASSFGPWEDEFEDTFGRPPRAVRLIGSSTRRSQLLDKLGGVEMILCTYQMAYRERGNLQNLLRQHRVLLVLDESHYVKNINLGPWAQTVLDLAPLAERRLILTGTPAPHSLRDLWSQFTFLWPSESVLQDRISYEVLAQEPERYLPDIRERIRPFFHRTKRPELGLPASETFLEPVANDEVPKRQKLILRLLELKILNEARSLGLGKIDMATLKRWRKARTIRLMQAASNPALLTTALAELSDSDISLDDEPRLAPLVAHYAQEEIPAKAQWTVAQTKKLIADGKKVVIWAHFRRNLEMLERLLKEFSPLVIHGGIPAYEEENDPNFVNRERNIKVFKEHPDRRILLANPGACSESISLHKVCQDAIYFERTFNCGQFLQSMDRINRVEMPPGTHARYFIPLMPCGIERVIQRRLDERQRTLYALLEDDLPVLSGEDELGDDFFEPEDNLEELFAEILAEIGKDVQEHE